MMDFLTNTNFLDQMLLLASAGADPVKHVRGISGFLGGFYVLMAMLNAGAAIYWWQYGLPGSKPATEPAAPAIVMGPPSTNGETCVPILRRNM